MTRDYHCWQCSYSMRRNLKIEMRDRPELIASNISPIIRSCAAGLEHLHNQGWIHCDVKPDNFLADDKAKVKLIDFSIAVKIKKSGLSSILGGGRAKAIRGTRSYMAPEQIRQKYPTPCSDMYGFGCMVFELLAGKPPFTANTPDELLQKHLKASVPSLEACSDASKDFAEIVKKMLAKKPADRFQTMGEFLVAFKTVQLYRAGKRPEGFRR